ncbi:MAG: hypothetical protein PHQ27_04565 [Victivallales bacterium]|nr:hypothetical protein [Victivallales bacterium]
MKIIRLTGFAVLPLLFWGCSTSHRIDTHNDVNLKPIEIKPIHITIDINVKVDRALDDFFGDVDAAGKKLNTAPTASASAKTINPAVSTAK